MKKIVVLILLLVAFSISGCAKPGSHSFEYVAPDKYDVVNEVTVDKPFDYVWDNLVRELAKNFFVINNIEKSSRIINVSYFSDHPEDYIDCGQSIRKTSRGDKSRKYKYASAADSNYVLECEARGEFEYSLAIDRDTDLEGRINIYVAPLTASKTKVSVNTIYVFNNKVRQVEVVKHVNGRIVNRIPLETQSDKKSFTTTEGLSSDVIDDGVSVKYSCVSKGVLESKLIGIVDSISRDR